MFQHTHTAHRFFSLFLGPHLPLCGWQETTACKGANDEGNSRDTLVSKCVSMQHSCGTRYRHVCATHNRRALLNSLETDLALVSPDYQTFTDPLCNNLGSRLPAAAGKCRAASNQRLFQGRQSEQRPLRAHWPLRSCFH